MIPVGYMAKRVAKRPDWLDAPQVADICSVSACISDHFADYVNFWKHNSDWFFDSPQIINEIAEKNSIHLADTTLFYYEAHEMEFDGKNWRPYAPASLSTSVVQPAAKQLVGFDVVTLHAGASPECSPLSCNSLAKALGANSHCLIDTFEEAQAYLTNGAFNNSEPGPYRIFSVWSVESPWSSAV